MPWKALALLLLFTAGAYYWLSVRQQDPPLVAGGLADSASDSGERVVIGAVQPGSNPQSESADIKRPNPDHPYRDTDVDGDVTVDADGHFQPDRQALSLFDYFFIESGRLSDGEILLQINKWLSSRLQQPALSEALLFLDQYMALRQLAAQAYAAGEMPADPRQRLELIRSLQRQAYGPKLAERLFAEEYRRNLAQLGRMDALVRGESVDPTAGMSEAESRVYNRTRSVLAAPHLAAESDSAEELWQKRSDSYGYDAAYRLEQLDQQRSEWQVRLSAYRLEMEALAADHELTESERDQLTQRLLEQHFNATEQTRVLALERIAASEAAAQ